MHNIYLTSKVFRLTDSWGELQCMFLNSINLEDDESLRASIHRNLAAVLATPILRHPGCLSRAARDCILASHAATVTAYFKSMLPANSGTNHVIL